MIGRATKLALAVSSLTLLAPVATASRVRSLNLEEMTERAAAIFAGRCSDLVETADGTVAFFEVRRAVKGAMRNRVSVRLPDRDDVGSGTGALPVFERGDDVVLFVYGAADGGFGAPVGLGQGRFLVISDKLGRAVALNDLRNRRLTQGLSPEARRRLGARLDGLERGDALSPDDLLDLAASLLEIEGPAPPGPGRR